MFPDNYLSRVTWMGMILHTNVFHDTGVVVAVDICPVRTFLVDEETPMKIGTNNLTKIKPSTVDGYCH